MMFLDCPAYLDGDGALRCGLPAEVEDRVTVMRSTSGPGRDPERFRCPAKPLVQRAARVPDPADTGKRGGYCSP